MNQASLQSVAVAAHTGMFHRVKGRWPRDRAELESFDCPALDANVDEVSFNDSPPAPLHDEKTCGFLVDMEYRIAWNPDARDLRMIFRDADGRLVCRLRVDAPGADSGTALAPMMTIHTSVFSCPGNGESLQ